MDDTTLRVLAPLRLEASAARRGATTADVQHTGMGRRRSRRSARTIAASDPSSNPVAVVGVCGGLDCNLEVGDVIVANELRSADENITIVLPGADLLAAELVSIGLPARTGAIVTTNAPATGAARRKLANTGALAVDMESVWLATALRHARPDRPLAVVRVVVDTPDHELWSLATPGNVGLARQRITTIMPALERWARAIGPRHVVLAGPRSFCAGVERAIEIVERALDRFEPPVYVRRQIVHNTHVVNDLERRGAIFVHELDEVPHGSVVVLAAHGVAPDVRAQADARALHVIDATCPLVAKVHAEARRFAEDGYDIVLVGHDDHEEVEGTLGEAADRITVIGTPAEVADVIVDDPERVAFLTQTTLAVDEVDHVVTSLRRRFPALVGPRSDDICYATQNRQQAIAAIAPHTDLVLVVGSSNSSNSRRLAEVAIRAGAPAHLVDNAGDVKLEWLAGATTIGVTAGASAPESKVQEIVAALGGLGAVTIEERIVHDESVSFRLPVEVR